MATAPANDEGAMSAGLAEDADRPTLSKPDVVDQVLRIPVHEIEMGERLRPVDPAFAEAVGRAMLVDGQQVPIQVCRLPGRAHWTLVAGGHRLTGARTAGMAYIKAIVVSSDAADRRMREISENLWRKGLDPLDRAAFIAELVQLHKVRLGVDPEKDGRAASVTVRWQKALQTEANDTNDTMSLVYGWSDEIGARIGLNKRTIERDLLLHRRLPAGLVARLRGHPVASNATQLRALAKLDEREQRAVVQLLEDGTAKSVGDAIGTLRQKRKPDPEDKRLSAFIGAFSRMSLTERKGALAQLVGMLTPSLVAAMTEAAPDAFPRLAVGAEKALVEAGLVLSYLLEGCVEVTDAMLESAYNACEAALHPAKGGAR